MENEETLLWKGTPSQLLNAGWFVLAVLFCWLIVPVIYALWKWLELSNRTFELTTERLRFSSGVLNKRIDSVELYRVKDATFEASLWLRLFGKGNIILETADATTPTVTIPAIADAARLRETILNAAEAMRDRKRVREIELA